MNMILTSLAEEMDLNMLNEEKKNSCRQPKRFGMKALLLLLNCYCESYMLQSSHHEVMEHGSKMMGNSLENQFDFILCRLILIIVLLLSS